MNDNRLTRLVQSLNSDEVKEYKKHLKKYNAQRCEKHTEILCYILDALETGGVESDNLKRERMSKRLFPKGKDPLNDAFDDIFEDLSSFLATREMLSNKPMRQYFLTERARKMKLDRIYNDATTELSKILRKKDNQGYCLEGTGVEINALFQFYWHPGFNAYGSPAEELLNEAELRLDEFYLAWKLRKALEVQNRLLNFSSDAKEAGYTPEAILSLQIPPEFRLAHFYQRLYHAAEHRNMELCDALEHEFVQMYPKLCQLDQHCIALWLLGIYGRQLRFDDTIEMANRVYRFYSFAIQEGLLLNEDKNYDFHIFLQFIYMAVVTGHHQEAEAFFINFKNQIGGDHADYAVVLAEAYLLFYRPSRTKKDIEEALGLVRYEISLGLPFPLQINLYRLQIMCHYECGDFEETMKAADNFYRFLNKYKSTFQAQQVLVNLNFARFLTYMAKDIRTRDKAQKTLDDKYLPIARRPWVDSIIQRLSNR